MNRYWLTLPIILALLQVSCSLRSSTGVEYQSNDLAKTGASNNMQMEDSNMAREDDDDDDFDVLLKEPYIDDDDDEDDAYDDVYGMSLAKSTWRRRTKE